MNRLELASMAAGSALLITGAAWIYLPAGLLAAGGLLLAAGWPK